jgi:hypothetical protein
MFYLVIVKLKILSLLITFLVIRVVVGIVVYIASVTQVLTAASRLMQ